MICDRFQLADVFGVSPDTVRFWTKSGAPVHREPKRGPGLTDDERKRLFDTQAVYRWLLHRHTANRW